jgi:hypothetical protein
MVNFLIKFSKIPLLDSPALFFFLSPGGKNLQKEKGPDPNHKTLTIKP